MHTVASVDRNHRHAIRVVAAALALAITVGMFWAVIGLFQMLGLPLGELAAAGRGCAERGCNERGCNERTYVSEDDACRRPVDPRASTFSLAQLELAQLRIPAR